MDGRKVVYVPMVLALAACSNVMDPGTRGVGSVGVAMRSVPGTVIAVQPVRIKTRGHQKVGTGVGMGVGTGVGALAAGSGNRIAGAALGGSLGALGGALVGGGVLNKEDGFEYTVQTDTGLIYTLTEGSKVVFQVGDRVLILLSGNGTSTGLRPYNG